MAASWREPLVGDPLTAMAGYATTMSQRGPLQPVLLERTTGMMCWTTIGLQTLRGKESLSGLPRQCSCLAGR